LIGHLILGSSTDICRHIIGGGIFLSL